MDEKAELNIEKSIEFQVENKVAWITIDNQKKGNGLTPEMRNHLIDLFETTPLRGSSNPLPERFGE